MRIVFVAGRIVHSVLYWINISLLLGSLTCGSLKMLGVSIDVSMGEIAFVVAAANSAKYSLDLLEELIEKQGVTYVFSR